MRSAVLLLVFLVASTLSLKLPHYIKACARDDPNFNECGKRSAIAAIPQFIHGDPQYRVPPLDPLLISELVVTQGTSSVGMSIVGHNGTLRGLKDVDMRAFRFDFEKQHIEYEWYFPELVISGVYNVSGRVLLLPIQGYGNGTIAIKKVESNYSYDFDLVKKKDNLEYLVPKNPHLTFKAGGMKMKISNLFNGDKFLGDNMNQFLNENWRDIMNDVGPAVADTLSEYIRQILTNVFLLVPYDEAIPPTLSPAAAA